MNSVNHPIFYAALMICAGIGIPIMATINAHVGNKLSNPVLATTILICTSLVTVSCLLLVSRDPINSPFSTDMPKVYLLSGVLFIFYISTVSWSAPRFGVGNSIAFVLLGQLLSITIIDHFQLFNAIHHPISFKRVLGLALMMCGIYLVVKKG